MFVCDDNYMTVFLVKGTTLFSQGTRGQLRAHKGRRDIFVPLWTKDRISFVLLETEDSLYANVLYVVYCACYVLTKHSLTRG